jgi:hypothetical protein
MLSLVVALVCPARSADPANAALLRKGDMEALLR